MCRLVVSSFVDVPLGRGCTGAATCDPPLRVMDIMMPSRALVSSCSSSTESLEVGNKVYSYWIYMYFYMHAYIVAVHARPTSTFSSETPRSAVESIVKHPRTSLR